MMKKILFCLFALGLATTISSCEKKDNTEFVVEGTVEMPEQSYIYIEEVLEESTQVIDSVKPNGKSFVFTLKPSEKAFYRLNIFGKQQAFIVGGPGEVLKVEVGGNAKDAKFKMSGTKDADLLYKAFLIAESLRKSEKELSGKYRDAQEQGNPQLAQEIVDDFDEILEAKLLECKSLIKEADNSLVALSIASNFFNTNEHFEFLDSLAAKFEKEQPESRYSKQFISMVKSAKALGIGSKAPDFQLATLDGKWLKLSEVKGKAIVIDFWASWCRPCRQENPFMVALYERY
ncbi:MAG: TlpA disulfide reductase family protein, partial [Cytophagales bacterium]